MSFGVKIEENGKVHCLSCGAHVGNDGKTQMNFCPKCGTHLRLNAAVINEKKENQRIIEVLYQIIDEIDERELSPTDIIKDYIKELADNK